jgi:hypothetical protein
VIRFYYVARGAEELTIADVIATLKRLRETLQEFIAMRGLKRPREPENFGELRVGEANWR